MPLNINGTTGISGVDGSASAPALQGTDSNTGINFGSDTVNINTGGVTRATVDSAGDLGLGVSPTNFGTYTTLHLKGPSGQGAAIRLQDNSDTPNTDDFVIYKNTSNAYLRVNGSDSLITYMNGAERMRIDSSGRVGIGTSSPDRLLDVIKGGTNVSRFQQTTNNTGEDHTCITLRHAAATSGQNGVGIIFQNTGGSVVGKIDFGQSSTQYRATSDYRLKENAVSISDGITRLKTLKPYRFNFIAEPDKTVDGFFAHEVTAVPEAISGTKDEVDSDNEPVYQGIDQSKLVPLLTAALQEAVAKIEVLETKVAALEAA